MTALGDWSTHDNKKYIGKLDRIYVSMTEDYEVEYFIDKYLEDHAYTVNNKNRDVISSALESYPGKAPFKRDDLVAFLDRRITRKS
ncbi:hypothetical protein SAMN05518845_11511 [Variovorax sp. YR750]|uniref:hypothetical protein n=1 Tax=Variovorax sp. YR750 TaxID=1884384 RepID=UPI0008D567EA|nr:hypothetical protein [Variovorax sp. YR750]SEM03502.1 hypothetical protein SAMN05518845_11511 [Variovorax sp. YR750]